MRTRWGVGLFAGCVALLLGPSPAHADDSQVDVRDNAFAPATVTVGIGESVTWSVDGDNPHTVTGAEFDSSPSCVAAAGLGCLHKGDKFTIAFNVAGRYQYRCKIHGDQGMIGTVVVQSATTETSSTTTSSSTSTSSTSTTTSIPGDASGSFASQGPPPTITGTTRPPLPKPVARSTGGNKGDDDLRLPVLIDVAIAGATTLVGVSLVRRGRVPFG